MAVSQLYGEPDLQLLHAAGSCRSSAAASAASPAAACDADVPGRIGDSGDRGLPGSTASAAAATAGARARITGLAKEKSRSGKTRAGFFYDR